MRRVEIPGCELNGDLVAEGCMFGVDGVLGDCAGGVGWGAAGVV